MRILYFSTSILPSRFANSVHVMKMSSSLAKNGNDVTLVGLKGKDNSKIDLYNFYNVEKNFNIILLNNGKNGIIKRIFYLFTKTKKFDLIYTRYATAAFICSKILNRKVIYEYHGRAISNYNKLLERIISNDKRVKHVFITDALRQEYYSINESLKNANCLTLSDAADDPNIQYEKKKDMNNISCGYIGSFQKGKGIELILELASKLPNITFHIVGGSDKEVEQFRNIYSCSNIVWYGFLSQKEAMKVLKNNIDIALLPNQHKVFVGKNANVDIGRFTSPMKLFEYMSYGKAIIASDIPVLKEILCNKRNAILVSPTNVDEWCEAIIKLVSNSNDFNTIRQNCLVDFKSYYTWERRAHYAISKCKN